MFRHVVMVRFTDEMTDDDKHVRQIVRQKGDLEFELVLGVVEPISAW